mmetsp:Transcript_17989/g.30625  ORF Transcript_17989/g.30625 Transcript_17989/m.30625 type:complete len:329 (+) Transcript_17989:1159-2145(+)
MYYEPVAQHTASYVHQTHGLNIVEKKKLRLDPQHLDSRIILDENISVNTRQGTQTDLEEFIEYRGEHGNPESLTFKGLQLFLQSERNEQSYKKAYSYFDRAVRIKSTEHQALYYMGLMNLVGYGREQNIELAFKIFSKKALKNDPRALNAIGYIYMTAPDSLDLDISKINAFGTLRRDLGKAHEYFTKSSEYDYPNAIFNLGSLYLQDTQFAIPGSKSGEKVYFSFSKAYSHFKHAAEKGHTLAAYNVAVMHYLGLGTYQSCISANVFIQHVANVGPHVQLLKKAHQLVQEGRHLKAAFMYMELAEMGMATAVLNVALLLDKYDVFQS